MSEKNELTPEEVNSGSTTALAPRRVDYFKPRYTSSYDDHAWEVSVDLPGVSKEDLKVTVEDEVLDIAALRHFELPEGWKPLGHTNEDRGYRLRLDVGPEVDETQISAELKDGVLTLRLPLREEVKPRSIEIK